MEAISLTPKEQMLMNWPERVWIYSPLRVIFLKREIRRWLDLTGKPTVDLALEIGCGLGKGAQLLVERMGFKRVVAFDLEQILVRRASRNVLPGHEDSLAFHVADAQDLPFRDEQFDAVVNFGIIHHVLDWRRCIAEISRVLRPGGYFYFEEIYPGLYAGFPLRYIVQHPTVDRFHEPQFLETLAAHGLHLVPGVKTGSPFAIVGAAQKR